LGGRPFSVGVLCSAAGLAFSGRGFNSPVRIKFRTSGVACLSGSGSDRNLASVLAVAGRGGLAGLLESDRALDRNQIGSSGDDLGVGGGCTAADHTPFKSGQSGTFSLAYRAGYGHRSSAVDGRSLFSDRLVLLSFIADWVLPNPVFSDHLLGDLSRSVERRHALRDIWFPSVEACFEFAQDPSNNSIRLSIVVPAATARNSGEWGSAIQFDFAAIGI